MLHVLLAGTGGFIGSVLRLIVSRVLHETSVRNGFPLGTLAVNAAGCLAIGFLAGLSEGKPWLTEELRLFLFIGILGGFTTFSSFGLDTISLLRNGNLLRAAFNVFIQIGLGLACVWGGFAVSRLFPR